MVGVKYTDKYPPFPPNTYLLRGLVLRKWQLLLPPTLKLRRLKVYWSLCRLSLPCWWGANPLA